MSRKSTADSAISASEDGGLSFPLQLRSGSVVCRVRISRRARRVSLRIAGRDADPELIVPEGASLEDAIAFARSKTRWLEDAISRMRAVQPSARPSGFRYPSSYDVPLLGGRVPVRMIWRNTASIRVQWNERDRAIELSGRTTDRAATAAALGRFFIALAERLLPPLVVRHAELLGVTVRRVAIRMQRRRWGSCTADGCVSLNAALLFFPQELVEYVILHELCHRLHLDHSARFWRAVERVCPDWRKRKEAIDRLAPSLPSFRV